jgi:NRAMP (natural resistance-associated macrophage protein)-like metal ion transporter
MAQKDIITKTVELPAKMMDRTIVVTEKMVSTLPTEQVSKTVKRAEDYWNTLGPGLTTGASDDDPSGIATYSQAGAKYGFQLLWLATFTFPLMAIVQEMCARIGMVTGRGLAGNIRRHFSKRLLYTSSLLLFAANAFNIGADLGAMAKAVQLIWPGWNFYTIVIGFSAFSLLLQVLTPYKRYAKYLKWLALVLLSYIASAILARLNWSEIMRGAVVPSLSLGKDQILLICAILGTTISPYLFFWQTSQEVEQEISDGKMSIASREGTDKAAIKNMRIDVWSGMLLSNVVMFFIIAACGALLYKNGITEIVSAAQAAEALRPFAGEATYYLFAIGIIGTGLLAIPVLAGSSSYALAESFGWKGGLNSKLNQAHAFYGTIIFSMLIGLSINFIGLDPIKALIYSAVFNGIVAPLVLVPIVLISSNKKVMGEWVNHRFTTTIGWLVIALMSVSGTAAIVSLFIA